MFTGLIEETGTVKSIEPSGNGINLTIASVSVRKGADIGDSIAIDGACQTVTSLGQGCFTVFASRITCEVTTLGGFSVGNKVNLERAMLAGFRFDGHIVQGHVDGKGLIKSVVRDENAIKIEISVLPEIMKYIVEKGSVTVDGISLTVVLIKNSDFVIYIIPETINKTILSEKSSGDSVNIEVDILAKYVEKMLGNRMADESTDEENLKRILVEGGYV